VIRLSPVLTGYLVAALAAGGRVLALWMGIEGLTAKREGVILNWWGHLEGNKKSPCDISQGLSKS